MIHLSFLVRKLTGTETGSLIYHYRWLDLKITCICVVVKEEVDEGPLKPCTLALVYRETSSCKLHTKVKVNDVKLLCEFPVRKAVLSKLRNLVTGLDNDIILCSLSFRNHVARDIRKKNNQGVKL